jgi:hypothetical protein
VPSVQATLLLSIGKQKATICEAVGLAEFAHLQEHAITACGKVQYAMASGPASARRTNPSVPGPAATHKDARNPLLAFLVSIKGENLQLNMPASDPCIAPEASKKLDLTNSIAVNQC